MPEDETPKAETEEEKKPEGKDTPSPPSHDIEEAIDKVSHSIEYQMGIFDGLFTKPIILLGILLGVFLQFLGAIMLNFDASNAISAFIGNLGIFVMVIVLFGGAITNEKLDPYVRMGMFVAGGFGIMSFDTWTY